MESKELLRDQITNAAGNVVCTYIAHWDIVNRLKGKDKRIKVIQIVLTALSTGGFATLFLGIKWFSWIGGVSSTIALAINLYILHFDISEDIKNHYNAANELWDVREKYKSLLVDFDGLTLSEIRVKRDELMSMVSAINHKYPGTDSKSIANAKKKIGDYIFEDNEAKKLL